MLRDIIAVLSRNMRSLSLALKIIKNNNVSRNNRGIVKTTASSFAVLRFCTMNAYEIQIRSDAISTIELFVCIGKG